MYSIDVYTQITGVTLSKTSTDQTLPKKRTLLYSRNKVLSAVEVRYINSAKNSDLSNTKTEYETSTASYFFILHS